METNRSDRSATHKVKLGREPGIYALCIYTFVYVCTHCVSMSPYHSVLNSDLLDKRPDC